MNTKDTKLHEGEALRFPSCTFVPFVFDLLQIEPTFRHLLCIDAIEPAPLESM